MPSRFEPCGISQMIALKYGTIPVVRETGGLKDTIIPYNEFIQYGNGFGFAHYNAHDMLFTLKRAINFYHMPKHWNNLFTVLWFMISVGKIQRRNILICTDT